MNASRCDATLELLQGLALSGVQALQEWEPRDVRGFSAHRLL